MEMQPVMQPVIRRIYRLALAVTLAAGMTIGLGACSNRQEVPANTQEENTQDEQTAAVPDNATQQETSASPSAPQGEPSSSSSQQPVDTNSDERNVRDAVTRMLDAIKNPSREGMEPYLSNLDSNTKAQLDAYGIDMYDFIEHIFKHFDYAIDDVQIDGNNATVKLTITNADLMRALMSGSRELQSLDQDTLQQLSNDGEKAIMQKYMELFYASIDDEENLTTTESELKLVKSGGVWKVDESSAKSFSHSMYGNVNLLGGGETIR